MLGAVSFRAGTSVRLSRRQGVVGRARGGGVAALWREVARAGWRGVRGIATCSAPLWLKESFGLSGSPRHSFGALLLRSRALQRS